MTMKNSMLMIRMDSDVFRRLVWLYHNTRCERLILANSSLLHFGNVSDPVINLMLFLNSIDDVNVHVLEVCSYVPSCMMLVVQIAI